MRSQVLADQLSFDEMIIYLKLELSRLNRDKSHLVLDKSLMLYFVFLFIGVLGFVQGYLTSMFLHILIYFGIAVLIIGLVPYITTMKKESNNMNELVEAMEHLYARVPQDGALRKAGSRQARKRKR